MNLDVFAVLFFGLLSQVYGYQVKSNCVEEHVGLYYVGENSTIYYAPNDNFSQGYMVSTSQPELYSMSYNNEMRSLLFLNGSIPNQIYEYNLDYQHPYHYFLHWTEQNYESQGNGTIFGKESNLVSDPSTGNFFFIHENNGIYVCDLAKKQCAEVLEPTQEKRRNLFLHPKNSVMYYIEGAYVKSARMDGQEVQIISESKNVNVILVSVNAKGHLFNLESTGQNTFYADCKFHTMYNDSGLLFVHHLNGQNETIGTQEPNTVFMMDSEPSSEILSLENFCKNQPCIHGICVNIRTSSMEGPKCLRNLTFEIKKFETNGYAFGAPTTMAPEYYMNEEGICHFELFAKRPPHVKCKSKFIETFLEISLAIIGISLIICCCCCMMVAQAVGRQNSKS